MDSLRRVPARESWLGMNVAFLWRQAWEAKPGNKQDMLKMTRDCFCKSSLGMEYKVDEEISLSVCFYKLYHSGKQRALTSWNEDKEQLP